MMGRITDSQRRNIFGAPCTTSNFAWVTTPWGHMVQAHKLVAPRFRAACLAADKESSWNPLRIDGFNCRRIRNSSAWSLHAYGLAWDFFDQPGTTEITPGDNAGLTVWGPDDAPDATFRAVFERFGFYAGAHFGDYPHIEWADGRPAPLVIPVPAPTPAPAPVEVRPMFDPPLQIVAALDCPTGGTWCLAPDGAIYAFGGAPYLGGCNGKAYFAGRTAARLNLVNGAYQIVATSGEVYGPGF
jgi:hypothetical protein